MTENKDIFETTLLTLNATLKGGDKESDDAVFIFEKVNGEESEELERITVQVKKEKWCDSATVKSFEVPLVADDESSYGLSYRVESGGKTHHGKQAYRVWPLSLTLTAKKEGGTEIFPGAEFRVKQGGQTEIITVATDTGQYLHRFTRKQPFSVSVNFPYELIKWAEGKDKGRNLEAEVRRKAYRAVIHAPESEATDESIKHYVNLPRDEKNYHGHRIAVEVGPEAEKRQYVLAGDIIYVEVVFDENNSDRNDPRPGLEINGNKFLPDDSHTCKGQLSLDEKGANQTIEIELGYAGGDICEIKVGVTDLCEDDSIKVINWRRFYYQITRPQTMPAPDLSTLFDALESVFIECELRGERFLGEGEGPEGSWISGSKIGLGGQRLLVIGSHNSQYFHKQFKFEDSPIDLHFLFCDLHLDSCRDTVGLTGTAYDRIDWPGKSQVPGLAYDVHATHGENHLALPEALTTGEEAVFAANWSSLEESGDFENKGGGIPTSYVHIDLSGKKETGGRVMIRFPDPAVAVLNSGKDIGVSLGLFLAMGPYPGASDIDRASSMLIAVQDLEGRRRDPAICSTMAHLVGHAMKMVCGYGLDVTGIDDPKTTHSRWYGTHRGHEGNHCATGISGADYGDQTQKLTDLGESATCPMYGEPIASKSAVYCDNCKNLILAARLDDIR